MINLKKIINILNIKYQKKFYRFLSYGVLNVILTNLLLQFFLLVFSTILATLISQVFNFLFGYYMYGKKVFKIKNFSQLYFIKYLFLTVLIWNINWILINFIHSYNISKNLAAFILIPFLALFSYFSQKRIIFI